MAIPVLQFKRGNAGVAGTVPALRPGEPGFSLNNFDFFIGIDTSVANNKFFGSHRYWGREDGTNALNLKLVDKDGTNYVAIKAPNTLGGNVTYTFPGTQGASNSLLSNDGSGNLSWASGSTNPVFAGIATFSGTTDNILGNADTGAVQIDGGLGINKNVTVGTGLSVSGQSYFTGIGTFASDLTVTGNLYVSGNTTQVNTTALTVEDRTIDLGIVNGVVPTSATTWDLGVLFNYYTSGSAKKSAVVWEHADTRFKFASVLSSDTDGSDNNTPQLTVTTFAPIEIGSLWANDCAGQSQVISCTGTTRNLENITIDGGTY